MVITGDDKMINLTQRRIHDDPNLPKVNIVIEDIDLKVRMRL